MTVYWKFQTVINDKGFCQQDMLLLI